MQNIFGAFRKNPLVSLYILVLAAVTIGISVMAAVKTGSGTVLTENKSVQQSSAGVSSASDKEPAPAAEKSSSSAISEGTSSSSVSAASADIAGTCIVTLFGSRYDVTPLRSSHAGGDVFVCGTDQTELYRSQHGTNLNRMQRYLVNGQSGTTTSSSPSNTGRRFSEEEKDDDD